MKRYGRWSGSRIARESHWTWTGCCVSTSKTCQAPSFVGALVHSSCLLWPDSPLRERSSIREQQRFVSGMRSSLPVPGQTHFCASARHRTAGGRGAGSVSARPGVGTAVGGKRGTGLDLNGGGAGRGYFRPNCKFWNQIGGANPALRAALVTSLSAGRCHCLAVVRQVLSHKGRTEPAVESTPASRRVDAPLYPAL